MFAASKTSTATSGYQISRSLRFNSADSAYLDRTPATATNRRTFTISYWVKRGTLGSQGMVNGDATSNSGLIIDWFANNNEIYIFDNNAAPGGFQIYSVAVYRDPSAWYHLVFAFDTTQATNTNRIKVYINGVQQDLSTWNVGGGASRYPSQNSDIRWNYNVGASRIGSTSGGYLNGYMTEFYNIDGQQLAATSFGQTNAQTGVWEPIAYAGTYGTNGFYLNFSDNSNTTAATLGKDYSGNGNNWTPNNFSVTAGAGNDSLVDSPTSYGTDTGVGGTVRGNYSTINSVFTALGGTNFVAITNGNLNITGTSSGNSGTTIGTMGQSTGLVYWECTITSLSSGYALIAAIDADALASSNPYQYTGWSPKSYAYNSSGVKTNNNSNTAYGSSFTTGDIIGVAVDCTNGAIYFSKNNTWQNSGNPTSGASKTGAAFTWTGGTQNMITQNEVYTTGASVDFNFGQRPFAYTAPSGFKALCTQNLPTPTIGATSATLANLYYDASLYTGTNATQSITNAGFQPDWVWIKARSIAYAANIIDSVRGSHKVLIPSSTAAEATSSTANGITSFNSNGFTLGLDTDTTGSTNASGQTFVAWQWKANGSGSTNTAGSITSTVSANTTSGFSVVTFTTDGTTKTVGHGLGVAPKLYIVKQRNGAGGPWYVFTTVVDGSLDYLTLNSTDAAANSSYTAPTSTVFEYNDDNAATQVAYCFAEVAGYSKFGSYTGNGSADGPFIYCGFRPAYVMFKNASVSGSWEVYDTTRNTYNPTDNYLLPNSADAEGVATNRFDYLSNGVKVRNTGGSINGSGNTIIFMAFASNPFKYSLAR